MIPALLTRIEIALILLRVSTARRSHPTSTVTSQVKAAPRRIAAAVRSAAARSISSAIDARARLSHGMGDRLANARAGAGDQRQPVIGFS
jgi:hypothetical protein